MYDFYLKLLYVKIMINCIKIKQNVKKWIILKIKNFNENAYL